MTNSEDERLGKAYARPLEMEVDGEMFTDYSVEWMEECRKALVGRIITQEGPFKGGLVMSYKNGLHQIYLSGGETIDAVWIWNKQSEKDPDGVSSLGWQLIPDRY